MLASPCALDTSSGSSRVLLPALLLLQSQCNFYSHQLRIGVFSIGLLLSKIADCFLQSAKRSGLWCTSEMQNLQAPNSSCQSRPNFQFQANVLQGKEVVLLHLRLTRAFILRWAASKPCCIARSLLSFPPLSLQKNAKIDQNDAIDAESLGTLT